MWCFSEKETLKIVSDGYLFASKIKINNDYHLINLYKSSRKKWIIYISNNEYKECFFQGCKDYYHDLIKQKKLEIYL